MTASPTVNIGSATLTENVAGTFRYISGVPYYNSGSPSLTFAGVTIDNLVGQSYTNQSNIVGVDGGTNQESTSSNAITNTDYTYANIDGSSSMLTGGIPTQIQEHQVLMRLVLLQFQLLHLVSGPSVELRLVLVM